MKALVMTAFNKLDMQDLPEPKAGPGEIVVKVGATGICGSDVHGFQGHSHRRQPGLVLGHETHGVVHATGEGIEKKWIGQRVSVNPLVSCGQCEMCRAGRQNVCLDWYLLGMDQVPGGFAEYVKVHPRQIIPLPDHVSDGLAVMVEPLANAVHMVRHTPEYAGLYPTAAVWGAGTLGMSILAVAVARGFRVKAVFETNPQRGAVALKMGAEKVINPLKEDPVQAIKELTNGRGIDVALEAVGLEITRQQACNAVVKGGTATILGLHLGPTQLDFVDLVRREVRIQCTYGYNNHNYQEAFEMVAGGRIPFDEYIDLCPLAEGQQQFERLLKDPGDRIKIALKP